MRLFPALLVPMHIHMFLCGWLYVRVCVCVCVSVCVCVWVGGCVMQNGRTAAMLACKNGHEVCVQLLIAAGVNMEDTSNVSTRNMQLLELVGKYAITGVSWFKPTRGRKCGRSSRTGSVRSKWLAY